MATSNLRVSADFFNQLSIEFQQLRITMQLLETFVSRAIRRGEELGDTRLILILDQALTFVERTQHLDDRLEKLLFMFVIAD